MQIRETDGTLHWYKNGRDINEVLADLKITGSYERFTDQEWPETDYAQELAAEEKVREAERAARHAKQREAVEKVKARVPELANDASMAAIYALWPAVDSTKLPNALKLAVREWAEVHELPDRTVEQ